MTNTEPVTVLLVEDDVVEVKAIRRAFRERRIGNPIRIAEDGLQALAILRGQDGQDPIRKPYMILLDLNMPRMNGIEFLRELRQDPDHRKALVLVLTTSHEETDRDQAYEHNVAGYVVKSDFADSFMKVIDLIQAYWKVVEFPT